jgi:hypothetical protein
VTAIAQVAPSPRPPPPMRFLAQTAGRPRGLLEQKKRQLGARFQRTRAPSRKTNYWSGPGSKRYRAGRRWIGQNLRQRSELTESRRKAAVRPFPSMCQADGAADDNRRP